MNLYDKLLAVSFVIFVFAYAYLTIGINEKIELILLAGAPAFFVGYFYGRTRQIFLGKKMK